MQAPPFALAEALAQLHRDELVLIPGYMPERLVLDMRDAIPPLAEFQFPSTPGSGDTLVFLGADRVQCLSPFFRDPQLHRLARAYIGGEPKPVQRLIEIDGQEPPRHTIGRRPLATSCRYHLGFLLYLCDLSEGDGPLFRRRLSHAGPHPVLGASRNNSPRVAGAADTGTRSFVMDAAIEEAITKHARLDVTCCGPKGSLLIYDATGFERLAPSGTDIRVILADCWASTSEHRDS